MLREASLDRKELNARPWRLERFISFVQNGTPFKTGVGPKYEDAVVTLMIVSKKEGVISKSSDLTDPKELEAFTEWVQGNIQEYRIIPIWNGKQQSWSGLYKDPQNFQFENPKEGSVLEKQLTPVGLGIVGKNISLNELGIIFDAINSRIEDPLATILNGLLESASSANGMSIEIPPDTQAEMLNVSESDKRKIIKDFGEILCAVVVARELYESPLINFPTASNNPLSDFDIVDSKTGQKFSFSVKSLSGSGAAIKNYFSALQDFANNKSTIRKNKKVAEVLLSLSSSSLHNSVLKLAQSSAFDDEDSIVKQTLQKLKSTLGLDSDSVTTDEEIFDVVMNSPDPKKIIKNYYNLNLPAAPRISFGNILSVGLTKDLVKSLFLYPVLRAALSELNSDDKDFKLVFANAINSMSISQATINFDNIKSPKRINVTVKKLEEASPENIEFVTKAGALTFKGGGVGVRIN